MKPELLAPAGNREALIAAVQNGADAVYLGAGAFNARRSAGNFDEDGLKQAVRYCHARGVKVHVTLNTLVRQNEIRPFIQIAKQVYDSGADAVIVQDLGAARILQKAAPGLSLHASTQMAVHNRAGVAFAAQAGFDRVVLAREMQYDEIAACTGLGIELEAFVHGALCVACSGQCLFSSLVGGRSGNRGMCAQPCRLEYEFLGKKGHLLSPKDLMSLENLNKLENAGVASLKIEGRLKRPEYVAVTTRVYRAALDGQLGDLPYAIEELRQMFNRGGFTCGYGPGMAETELMFRDRANNMGVQVGECRKNGFVQLERGVLLQDSLALRRGKEDIPVQLSGEEGRAVPCAEARKGDVLYRTVSEAQMKKARESCDTENRAVKISGVLRLHVGNKAQLEVTDGLHSVCMQGNTVEPAQKLPVDRQRVLAQLQKTGGTAYIWENLACEMDDDAFLPVSALNALRRVALEQLEKQRLCTQRNWREIPETEIPEQQSAVPKIVVQSADIAVLLKALKNGADEIVFAPEDIREEALAAAAEAFGSVTFCLAPPPVLQDEPLMLLNKWAAANKGSIQAVYITNAAHLAMDWPGERRGGFMMNCANVHTVQFLQDNGITRYTPSVELTAAQIRELRGTKELVVYGRMPLMWLRHCPMRAALDMSGRHEACRNCDFAAPCDMLNGKTLRDRKNAEFPLRRFATRRGCIVLLQNCNTLMLLRHAGKLPSAYAWRLILGPDDDVADVVRAHCMAAQGHADEHAAALRLENTTTGHYFRGVE